MPRYNRPLVRLVQVGEFRVDRHAKLLENDDGLLNWELDEEDLVDEAQYDRILAVCRLAQLQVYYQHVATGDERRRAALAFRAIVVNRDFSGYDGIFFPAGREMRLVERDGRFALEPHPLADDTDEERWERLRPFLEELWHGLDKRKSLPRDHKRAFIRTVALKHGVHPKIALEHVYDKKRASSEAV